MIVPVMAISNLVLTQQIYSEETNGAHAHYREPVPLNAVLREVSSLFSIKHVFTSSYRPRANGAKERVHRFMSSALAIFASKWQK